MAGVADDVDDYTTHDQNGALGDVLDEGSKEAEQVLAMNPNQWSEKQTIGVAVGGAVGFVLILVMLWCCFKFKTYCRYKRSKGVMNPRHKLSKPYVLRRAARTTPGTLNSNDKLPQGCTLHGAEKLHAAGLDGKGVRVAVIDTGIDKEHPDLEGRVVRQEWYRLGTSLDIDDHGTHVAGTIHFMAPKANIYDFRVIGKQGEITSDQAVAAAIRDAVAEGCHIINMSIRISYPILKDIKKAVKYAQCKGVIMVCATGNYPGDDDPTINLRSTYPAKWKETISVAAVKKAYGTPVASFSDVVVGPGFNVADFAAVGQEVLSLKPGGGYQIMSGTSVAAPHLTGMLAAMMTGGGDVKKRAKKLVAELRSTYALDVKAKGSDSNTTEIGFPTFLTKWEFDKFWRRYSLGIANLHEQRPSILTGRRSNSDRRAAFANDSAATNPQRSSWSGRVSSRRNSNPDKSPPRRSVPAWGKLAREDSGRTTESSSSSRNMNRANVGPSSSSFGDNNVNNSSFYKLPRRTSVGDGRRGDWGRRNSEPINPKRNKPQEKKTGGLYQFSRRSCGYGKPASDPSLNSKRKTPEKAARPNADSSLYQFPRRNTAIPRPASDPSLNSRLGQTHADSSLYKIPRRNSGNGRIARDPSRRKHPEKGRKRSRSGNGRVPRARPS